MAPFPHLTIRGLPEFITSFFSSPFVASWLGISIPVVDDLRECVLSQLDTVDTGLLRTLFHEFSDIPFQEGFDDRFTPETAGRLLAQVLPAFTVFDQLFEQQGAAFIWEMQFQLPFIDRSRFTAAERRSFATSPRELAERQFRRNYRGSISVALRERDVRFSVPADAVFRTFDADDDRLPDGSRAAVYLWHPPQLTRYWEASLERTFARCR